MTTIAYRDGIIAVDSLCLNGGSRRGYFDKAISANRRIYAACGDAQNVIEFFDWARALEPGDFKFSNSAEGFAGLILCFRQTQRGELYTCEGALKMWPVRMPFTARGSGCDYAIGAMAAGASAPAAVMIAATFDVGTGGPVQVWRLQADGTVGFETLAGA